ncbi:hypothetical protein J6P68_05465 [bacterium]|nr:hypothetical protein [bacterium]
MSFNGFDSNGNAQFSLTGTESIYSDSGAYYQQVQAPEVQFSTNGN